MHELHPGGDCPVLNQGVRPHIHEALATFGKLRTGATFHIAPSAPRTPSWSMRATRAEKLRQTLEDPRIEVRESNESDLILQIESAMAGGEPVNGFVGFLPTLTGIKAIPHIGKPIVAKDVRTLARLIDRQLLQESALTLLGLDPRKPAKLPVKKPHEKLTLADLRRVL